MVPELDALTGIRAIAAVEVIFFHYREIVYTLFPGCRWLDPHWRVGYLGVDQFFIHSGFILSYKYADRFTGFRFRDWLWFCKLRIARIYPVHLLTLHLSLLAFWGSAWVGVHVIPTAAPQYAVEAWARNVFMVHSWFGLPNTCNGASWSISCEWWAYMLFPFIMVGLYKARRQVAWLGIGVVAVGVALPCAYYALMETGDGWMTHPVVAVTVEFVAGCLGYQLYRRARDWPHWGALSTATVAAVMVLPWILVDKGLCNLVLAGLFTLIVLGLSYGRGPVARLLGTRTAVFWGKASYSLYMVHGLLHQILGKVIPVERWAGSAFPVRLAVLGVYAGVVFGSSALCFLKFEQPLRAWIRRLPVFPGPHAA